MPCVIIIVCNYRRVITSAQSWTPMHVSCFYNNILITKLMLETDLHNISVLQYYVKPLQSPAYNRRTTIGWSPIFYTSSVTIVEAMLHVRQSLREKSLQKFEDLKVVTRHGVPLLWECAGRGIMSITIFHNLIDQVSMRVKGILPLENGEKYYLNNQ